MSEHSITELNKILKGEHMAIDIYNTYISKIEQQEIKKELQKIQLDHKRHATRLSKRIQELGGEPNESRGIGGFMAKSQASVQSMFKINDNHVLKEVYDGEDQGIARVEQIMENLDDESREMVNQMISDDHDHLRVLEHLISQSGQLLH